MKNIFDSQSFSFQKKLYKISHAGIGEALGICINHDFATPLTEHNYLKKIMISISEREGKGKSIQDEKDLRGRESDIIATAPQEEISSEQAKKNLQRVGEIIKSIGG